VGNAELKDLSNSKPRKKFIYRTSDASFKNRKEDETFAFNIDFTFFHINQLSGAFFLGLVILFFLLQASQTDS
jgi:hypothetical protein